MTDSDEFDALVGQMFDAPILAVDELNLESLARATDQHIAAVSPDEPATVMIVLGDKEIGLMSVRVDFDEATLSNFGDEFPNFVQKGIEDLAAVEPGNLDVAALPPALRDLTEEILGKGFVGVVVSVPLVAVSEPDKELESVDPELYDQWMVAWSMGKIGEGFTHFERQRATWAMDLMSNLDTIVRDHNGKVTHSYRSGKDWKDGGEGGFVETIRAFIRMLISLMVLKGYYSHEAFTYWHSEASRLNPEGAKERLDALLKNVSPQAAEAFRRLIEGEATG